MIGPTEMKYVTLTCDGCDYHSSDLIISGNEGFSLTWHYCNHENANNHLDELKDGHPFSIVFLQTYKEGKRYIGETSDTPEWCPERSIK